MAGHITHHPVRMCIGCRERDEPGRLLRVVARDTGVIPDPHARLPGRGAWLHVRCLAEAERRRAFGRALRVPEPVDLGSLREWIAACSPASTGHETEMDSA